MEEHNVILSFKQNWQRARKDGWRIKDDIFLPPKESEPIKNFWAAVFYTTDYGIAIPHWFLKYYPLK